MQYLSANRGCIIINGKTSWLCDCFVVLALLFLCIVLIFRQFRLFSHHTLLFECPAVLIMRCSTILQGHMSRSMICNLAGMVKCSFSMAVIGCGQQIKIIQVLYAKPQQQRQRNMVDSRRSSNSNLRVPHTPSRFGQHHASATACVPRPHQSLQARAPLDSDTVADAQT